MPSLAALVLVPVLLLTAAVPAAAAPAAPTPSSVTAAVEAYKAGQAHFEAGDKAQALIEFRLAQELAPSPKNIFMMAQCEYHLGQFKEARARYQEFLAQEPKGIWADTARQRIEAINRRKGVIVVRSAPLGVDILIEKLDAPPEPPITGQAPNDFPVGAGRWRVTAKMTGYQTERHEVRIDSVDTIPLFFALERQPAHLEIFTVPEHATLYVRGNRARNPYVQSVEPGAYEVYAEATSYESRTETYILAPGERRRIPFRLPYVQRSGRPELLWFWTGAGAVGGATAVLARLRAAQTTGTDAESVTAAASVTAGAALVGGVVGALTSSAFLPDYLPDNRALFRIGAAWIGAAEGATAALALKSSLPSAFLGGVVGLGAGAIAGTIFDDKAPNYGRVALIQSGAAAGMLAGALAVPAIGLSDPRHRPLAILGGLNLGLGAGLALAYLPNQAEYGPRWQRVMMIDLAMGAGTLAGALVRILGRCLQPGTAANQGTEPCSFYPTDPNKEVRERRLMARFALSGGAIGLVAGYLLTRGYDRRDPPPLESEPPRILPTPTMLPVPKADGGLDLVPGLAAAGQF